MTNSGGGPHCYGDDDDLNLQPNPANDGSNPEQRFDPPPPPASDPTGNEVTQDDLGERGRCYDCLLYTSPSPRDLSTSRMPSSA